MHHPAAREKVGGRKPSHPIDPGNIEYIDKVSLALPTKLNTQTSEARLTGVSGKMRLAAGVPPFSLQNGEIRSNVGHKQFLCNRLPTFCQHS